MTNLAANARAKAQNTWPGATVHGRGRNWIRHRHPAISNRFVLDTFIGPVHYGSGEDQEIDTAWQVSAGVWDYEVVENDFHCFVNDSVPVSYRYVDVDSNGEVTLTVTDVEWVNELDDREVITSFSQVTPSIVDDRITWSGISTGWDVTLEAQTERLAKWIMIDSLANLGSPTIGGSVDFVMSFRMQLSSGVDAYVDGLLWDKNTTQSTSSVIEFKVGGTSIFYFKVPSVGDANEQIFGTMSVRKTGANLFVEIHIPWFWLQSATYPIEIDPTIEPQVSVGADDFLWYEGSTNFYNSVASDVAGWSTSTNQETNSGMHFKNIDSGLNGVITSAYVIFISQSTDSNTTVNTNLCAVDAQDPTTPTTYSGAETATRTTAIVAWDNLGTWTLDQTYNSAEIKTVIQELVDSYDYSSGTESILIYWEDDGSTASDGTRRLAYSYDQSSTNAPKLHIEYDTSGGNNTVGRMYTVSNTVAGVTAATDLIRISAPADAVVVVHKVIITQETEFGDAASEQLDVMFHRGSTDGSGGATPTASPLEVGDAAFGGSCATGNTTQSTDGTILHREAFNVMAGLYWTPTPEERIVLSPSGRFIASLETAPDDSIDFRVTAYFEEIGG